MIENPNYNPSYAELISMEKPEIISDQDWQIILFKKYIEEKSGIHIDLIPQAHIAGWHAYDKKDGKIIPWSFFMQDQAKQRHQIWELGLGGKEEPSE